uniref:MIF4G domain-containing protein n=1 Tax=viral metagenome TaxID=1070528 RepID=A0A6C0DH17_9ZZZZ
MSQVSGPVTDKSIIETLEAITSCRKSFGPPSTEVLHNVERIREMMTRDGGDNQGWRRIPISNDWRRGGGRYNNSSSSSSSSSSSNNYRQYRPANTTTASSSSATSTSTTATSTSATATTTTTTTAPPVHTAPYKYVSKFKSAEKDIDPVLLIIQDKLNRFSVTNYNEIHDFLCQIMDSGRTEFLKSFMKLVFDKATMEEVFCPTYVKLLSELSSKYAVLTTEMINRYKEYISIFSDVSESPVASDSKTVIETTTVKKYRLGYSQFLAEMIKYNILDAELFLTTIQTIVETLPKVATSSDSRKLFEEYANCLMRILKGIQGQTTPLAMALKSALKERYSLLLDPLTKKNPDLPSLSDRGRFTIMDILDKIKML